MAKLNIPVDNPAWAKAAPAPYSAIILPDFDEEEYINRSKEDEDAADATMALGNEASNLMEEAGRTVAKAFREKATEEPKEDTGEDAAQDLPPEL